MRILIVTTEIGENSGGLSLSCQKLYNMISEKHDVEIIDSTQFPIEVALGGKHEHTAIKIRFEYKLKTDLLTHKNSDIVIAFGGGLNGYYASLLSKRIDCRFILCLRGSDINLCKWSMQESWFIKESIKQASDIVCLSNEMIGNISSLCKSATRKAIIIPNENSPLNKHTTFKFNESKVVIGCAASYLNEKKGIANLLCMVKIFKSEYDFPIQLELVGSIDPELKDSYQTLVQKYDIENNVSFVDRLDRESLSFKMHKWDFYIQGSVCEGHPNSVIEALNSGCGFISSRSGYIYEKLNEKFPQLFFTSLLPEDMAKDLFNLIRLPEKEELFEEVSNHLQNGCTHQYVQNLWNSLLTSCKPETKDLDIEHIITLGLHDVQGEIHDSITTPTEVFRQFVHYVYERGHVLCSMKDYMARTRTERKSCIVLTFDDGYSNLAKTVAPILNQFNFSATVFVCSGLIGKDNTWNNKDSKIRRHLTFDEITSLRNQGWEIGSHGVLHKNMLKLSDEEVDYELTESQKAIERIAGSCTTYAYPYGASNKFIQGCVKKYYDFAFSVSEGGTSLVTDNMQIRRYSITEIYQMLK